MSPREDDVLPTSTSVETYTRWWMAVEERIGRNTKRLRYSAVRLRRRARRCREDGRPTWRERISCLVKFHGTMDGTRVAVCNLQPSFNQYSRYTYGPRKIFDFRKLDARNFTSELRRSFRTCCWDVARALFSFSWFKHIFHASDVILFSIATQFARSLAAFYESESESWFCVKFDIKLAARRGKRWRKWENGTPLKIKSVLDRKIGCFQKKSPKYRARVWIAPPESQESLFTKLVGALRPGYGAEVMKCEHPWRGVALLYKRLFVRSLPAFITDDLPTPSADPPPPSTHDISFTAAGRNSVRIERRKRSGDG